MLKIHRATSTLEADIIKSVLEDHGIPCVVQGYHHRSLLGFIGAYIECDILVDEKQAEEARALIEETKKSALPAEAQPSPSKPPQRPLAMALMLAFVLPGLGSLSIGRKNLGEWLMILTVVCIAALFFGMFGGRNALIPYAAAGLLLSMISDVVSVLNR